LAVAVAVLLVGAARGPLGGATGASAGVGVLLLVSALALGSIPALGTSVGMLALATVFAGLGRPHDAGGYLGITLVAGALLALSQLGCWSIEIRSQQVPGGADRQRAARLVATAIGGGVLGGAAVALGSGRIGAIGGIFAVVAGAVAACLVLVLVVSLVASSEGGARFGRS